MNLLCSIPHPKDATSLYRGVGPFQQLGRTDRLRIMITNEMDWTTLKGADAVFFQRPALDDRVAAVKMCKLNGKKVWIDYDDNLHAIPLCNRRYPTYGHPQIQHNIATMAAMADVLTVTTEHLADSFRKLIVQFPKDNVFNTDPAKVVIIPNAYDPEIQPNLAKAKKPRNKLVLWRGSDSHCKDLMLHTDEICSVIGANPDWKFEFLGEPFWWTIEAIQKIAKPQTVAVTRAMDPIEYFHYLDRQAPALMIVPLEDIAFNRSKSNIAWIEATAAGAVTLAPAWVEWSRPGVITYNDAKDFGSKLQGFLSGQYDADLLWRQSRDYIVAERMLAQVNDARRKILQKIAG